MNSIKTRLKIIKIIWKKNYPIVSEATTTAIFFTEIGIKMQNKIQIDQLKWVKENPLAFPEVSELYSFLGAVKVTAFVI